ncbi:MAG: amidohydrolase family protein [Acidobacteria bacterium]|nr:amidohydrolase family protein [Acidobacteriota bacterium]MCI0719615.1 amidohydrolase family protein [Acidobacteriota bacterium]
MALIKVDLKLAFRDKAVIFFNYLFPLIFFFVFAGLMKAERGGAISYVVSLVLVMGILGNGLFGAGIRAVQERETNILRRFKVAPISPAPLLVASLVSGWVIYIPIVLLILGLAHFIYGMAVPGRPFAFFSLISIGVLAFRALGLILASVANSMQGSQVLIQLFYMPMLFLSGATFPITLLPEWAQLISQFMPASYLVTGFQGIFFRNEPFTANASPLLALLATLLLGTFLSVQLFRWEKDEKIRPSARLWVLVVLLPFIVLGSYQAYSREHLRKARLLMRDLERSGTFLIRGARIFVGDGRVIESGGVLVKKGRIEEVFESEIPPAETLKATVIEGSGKTLLPGLIDMHVHLGAPAGFYESEKDYAPEKIMLRALAAQLYSGVTTVKSVGDGLDDSLKLRASVAIGERVGAALFTCGPMFTAEGGHGTEFFEGMPEAMKRLALQQWVRLPKSPDEARQQVRELKAAGVDGIKGILEAGLAGQLFNRLDVRFLQAAADEARVQKLPVVLHTGNSQDIADALLAGTNGIEHGSTRDRIPDELLAQMAKTRVSYDPTLCVVEAFSKLGTHPDELLSRSLVQQVVPAKLLENTRKALQSDKMATLLARLKPFGAGLEQAKENLKRAYQAGVPLVAGSDAGNLLVFHGPSLHRELQLWVSAGISPATALQAATRNAARLLGADHRIGSIQKGGDADLLLVDGNPLEDITATERISQIIYKGERINRSRLFDQE